MSGSGFRGVFLRGLSCVLDSVIDFSILFICYSVVDLQPRGNPNILSVILSCIVGFFALFCYEFLFISSRLQATPGKIFFNCYVGDVNGEKISKKRSFARAIIKGLMFSTGILSFVSLIVTFFSKEKASLHDRICSTRVFVREK
ncbi:MAG: RDD family protein [Proteobacteria bacterium]|nr:RDD family protein [Pseudomonadota bacterium]